MTDRQALLALVDHTARKPETTRADVVKLCAEARQWGVASVCVNSGWVGLVHEGLTGSAVKTCSVVGFPLGAMEPHSVGDETRRAIADGASEIDMVIPIGRLIEDDEIAIGGTIAVVRAAAADATLKVILETAALTSEQIVNGCRLAIAEGVDFVKTSTGFHPKGGATVEAVRLMRDTVGPDVGVKASGGIRTVADANAMVEAGASRLGMSATSALLSADG